MTGFDVLPAVRDGPERGLFSIAGPVALLTDRIPARLMLPMIIAAAHDQTFFCPDHLRPDEESGLDKALGDRGSMEGAVPDRCNFTRKQCPGCCPIGALVVFDFAAPRGVVHPNAMPPF